MIIELKNITKSFKERGNKNLVKGLFDPQWKYSKGLNEVSFEVKKGESVAFLGPNGAGKTTTTKIMTGLVAPTSGDISILGHIPFDRNPVFLKQIGLVLGNKAGLNWDLTATQSFWLLMHVYEIEKNEFNKRVKKLTKMLNVEDKLDTQIRKLSLGERMKFELIGAILHEPKILFLDEPTIGLDIDSKIELRKFLRKLQESGVTLVLTSHDMDDIEEVCDRVLVINKGEIVYDDSLKSLLDRYQETKYVRMHFKGAPPKITDNKKIKIIDESNGFLFELPKKDLATILTDFTSNYDVDDIDISNVSLEKIISDIFNS